MEHLCKNKTISNPQSVIRNLKSLLFSTTLSDFTIVLDDCNFRIPTHSQILASSSPYFASLLFGPFVEGSSKELHISDMEKEIFCAILKFVYTGECEVSLANIVRVIQAANRFCISEAISIFTKAAQEMIEEFDNSEESIAMLTAILTEAYELKIEEVCEMCLEYIDVNTRFYLESDSFLELSFDILQEILSRDTLFDGLQEVSLYLACLRWARGFGGLDPEKAENFEIKEISKEKIELAKELMKFVRLPLIEAKYVVHKIDKSGLFPGDLLYVAVSYQACPESYANDPRNFFRERMGSKKPWDWSEEQIGPHILLSNDRRLAIAHHYDWEKVIGKTIFYAGIHSFKVQLDLNLSASSNSWQIIVGVASPSTSLTEHLGAGLKEWGLACYSGHKISCGDKREEYTTGSKKGEIIEVRVDLALKRLEFLKNGLSMGIAFHNVTPPVCPAVSLLKGQRVRLIWD